MNFSVIHTTKYNYDAPVSYCQNIATIKPRTLPGQHLIDYSLEITPKPNEISERVDFFGNFITRFSIQKEHKKLRVTTRSKILRDVSHLRDHLETPECKTITVIEALKALHTTDPEILNAKQFTLDSILINGTNAAIKAYAEISFTPDRSVFDAAYELMQRIYTDFQFMPDVTSVSTPITEVMEKKKGVCQDFAQIAIACIRSIGLPARYVSGYIETIPPPGKEKLVGTDASHAWFSIYIPKFGWVDFDPTNNQIPENQHIVVGWGRDYYDVPPLKGVVYGSGSSKLKVSVDIRPYKD